MKIKLKKLSQKDIEEKKANYDVFVEVKEKKIKVMTKREIQRLHREQFFTIVCEKYPGTVIDSDGFGRWNIDMENGFRFDLSGISYGGQIDCYEIRGSEQYEEGQVLEKELQLIWDNLK